MDPSPSLLIFVDFFDDQTDDTASPQTFHHSRAYFPTLPLYKTPTFIYLLREISKNGSNPKAQASPHPVTLFFNMSLFALPRLSNRRQRPNPDGLRPAHGVGERQHRDWMAPLLLPRTERREKPMEVGWGGSSWLLCVHFLDVLRVFKVAGKIITQKDNIMAGIKKI